jgi:hypothetical protein
MTKAEAVDANIEKFVSGKFEKRASSVVSNAKLYDLVQDMAHSLDFLLAQNAEMHQMLTTLMERSNASL